VGFVAIIISCCSDSSAAAEMKHHTSDCNILKLLMFEHGARMGLFNPMGATALQDG
jgi:hypothetical protein